MTRDFTSVGVIGLGTMGAGIVEVFARNGIDVIAVEVDEAGIEHGKAVLGGSTGRALSRGKLTQEEHDALHARVTFTSDLADLADCQLVVEAVPEHLDLKKELLGKVDAVVSPDAILATNTSSLPVTEIAVATSNPKRVVGMHFFNPAPVQQFVEVIRTVITADDVFEDVKALAERLGKKPVDRRRQGRLHRQRAAVRLPQPRGLDVREPVRHPRGPRRGDALRLRLPDGPAGAARPDRPRHRLRDPRHDVQAGPRPAARAEPDHQADGQRRAARAARAGGASTPTPRPGSPQVVADAQTPAGGPPAGVSLRPVASVGVVGSGTMATGIIEVFAKAGYAVTFVARSEEKVAGVLDRARSQLRPRGREGPDGAGCRRRAARAGRRRHRARGPGRRRPGRRGDRRGPRRQAATSSATSTGSASRAPSSPRPRRRCRSSTAPRSPTGRRTSSGCTSSTRRRS